MQDFILATIEAGEVDGATGRDFISKAVVTKPTKKEARELALAGHLETDVSKAAKVVRAAELELERLVAKEIKFEKELAEVRAQVAAAAAAHQDALRAQAAATEEAHKKAMAAAPEVGGSKPTSRLTLDDILSAGAKPEEILDIDLGESFRLGDEFSGAEKVELDAMVAGVRADLCNLLRKAFAPAKEAVDARQKSWNEKVEQIRKKRKGAGAPVVTAQGGPAVPEQVAAANPVVPGRSYAAAVDASAGSGGGASSSAAGTRPGAPATAAAAANKDAEASEIAERCKAASEAARKLAAEAAGPDGQRP